MVNNFTCVYIRKRVSIGECYRPDRKQMVLSCGKDDAYINYLIHKFSTPDKVAVHLCAGRFKTTKPYMKPAKCCLFI